jgi:hypothetical protein
MLTLIHNGGVYPFMGELVPITLNATIVDEEEETPTEPMIFHDCLGRVIKVGDVLANGQRQGTHGGIRVGVVTGFTPKTILANMLQEGYSTYNPGRDHAGPSTEWSFRKGHFNTGYNCCITGMTEMELLIAIVGLPSPTSIDNEELRDVVEVLMDRLT